MGKQTFDIDQIKIETNVPVPPGRTGKQKWLKVLLRMKLGNSIVVPREHLKAIRQAASDTRTYQRKTVETDRVWVRAVDLKNGSVRVWRIACPLGQGEQP